MPKGVAAYGFGAASPQRLREGRIGGASQWAGTGDEGYMQEVQRQRVRPGRSR